MTNLQSTTPCVCVKTEVQAHAYKYKIKAKINYWSMREYSLVTQHQLSCIHEPWWPSQYWHRYSLCSKHNIFVMHTRFAVIWADIIHLGDHHRYQYRLYSIWHVLHCCKLICFWHLGASVWVLVFWSCRCTSLVWRLYCGCSCPYCRGILGYMLAGMTPCATFKNLSTVLHQYYWT